MVLQVVQNQLLINPNNYLGPRGGNNNRSCDFGSKTNEVAADGLGNYTPEFKAWPNPFSEEINFELELLDDSQVEIKIVDEQGREKEPGEEGEIMIRSPSNFRGYWGQDETNAALFQDGFFATGDIGRFDDEGYLYITDRAKDIVIRGGENIGCAEVESAIHEDPAVAEAAVFGVPDERLGEVPVAVISLRPGRQTSSDAIHSELKKHLAPFKIPDRIQLRRDPLPRVASGKIYKKRLREEFIRSLS